MAWQAQSRRRTELPRDWPRIRRTALDRDQHRCQIQGAKCTSRATEVDHIGDRMDHNPDNLRAVCHPCHAGRTTAQSHATRPSRQRPAEKHPGLI